MEGERETEYSVNGIGEEADDVTSKKEGSSQEACEQNCKCREDETNNSDLEAKRQAAEDLMSAEEKEDLKQESLMLKNKGNDRFGVGDYQEAINYYTKALKKCPLTFKSERATYLSNRAASYIKLLNWDSAIKDCTTAIELGPPNDKPLERRAHAYSMIENDDKALEDYQNLIRKYPDKRLYRERAEELKKKVEERQEKMKQDMIEKLKGLGNMFLRPFGLSTDNFELQKQDGGGYSINFKQ